MKKHLLLLLFLHLTIESYSQRYILTITEYTTKNGLSNDKVFALHKDSRGFIWIGTSEGLNRFDGQGFESHSKETHLEMTINIIHEIVEDDDGYLWLLKANGIYEQSYYSPEINLLNIYTGEVSTLEKRFEEALPFEVKNIGFIEQVSDGRLFLSLKNSNKGFFYQTQTGFQAIAFSDSICNRKWNFR